MKYICRTLLVLAAGCLANGQFMPQSHLGRLMQSITSPLMPFNGEYRDAAAQAELGYPPESTANYQQQHQGGSNGRAAHSSHGLEQGSGLRQEPSRMDELSGRQLAMMQSQQRGVPQNQHYGYNNNHELANNNNQHQQQGPSDGSTANDDEPIQATRNRHRHSQAADQEANEEQREKVGAAPSRNNEHRNQLDYQMGAYLGPSVDDKEIQGAFNSNNDERDDDDGPSNYDGADSPVNSQPRHKAASQSLGQSESNFGQEMGFGPSSLGPSADGESFGSQRPGARSSNHEGPAPFRGSGYDEDSVDEDDQPAARPAKPAGRRANKRAHLNQAASQFQRQPSYSSRRNHQGHNSPSHNNGGPMLAAANGYAPFGYAGPVELAGVINSLAGGDPNAGYQIYGPAADAGAFNPGPNYYQQQGQGRRKASASANGYGDVNDGYGAAPMAGRPMAGQQHRANNDNDDHDEADDD